jgi:hypothetical protein
MEKAYKIIGIIIGFSLIIGGIIWLHNVPDTPVVNYENNKIELVDIAFEGTDVSNHKYTVNISFVCHINVKEIVSSNIENRIKQIHSSKNVSDITEEDIDKFFAYCKENNVIIIEIHVNGYR